MAAQRGDAASLGILLERHRASMYALALRILGRKPEAQDAVQDAFLVALSGIDRLRKPEAVGGWLHAILRNLCYTRLRKGGGEIPLDEPSTRAEVRSPEPTAEEIVDGLALHEWVWTALSELPEDLRVTTMLLYFGSYTSYREIDAAQIVYLDQHGQGRSARVPVESCTIEQMADDAAAFCRALGIERPAVLGHSFGGFVALHLALRHPDVAGSLILIDTAASGADTAGAMERLEERHGPEVRAAAELVFGGDVTEETMAEFGRLVAPAYVHAPEKVGPVLESLGRSSFTPEVAAHFFGHRAALYDVRDRLGEIHVPTLVVVGGNDWLIPPSASRVIAEGIPSAELLVIPEAGHFSFIEHSDVYTDAVRRCLSTPVAA
jgi:proline iminopeptidase